MNIEVEEQQNEIEKLKGCYKISRAVLMRMLDKTVVGRDGKQYLSMSKCEILTMLYFTHIADAAGYIEYVKINELGKLLGYSGRNTYHVIDNLVKKGFVESSGSNWTGYRSIRICENDYSKVKDFHKNRYLNTNLSFFDRSSKTFFKAFSELSLYAMRTFLHILYHYDGLNGYRFSIDRLMSVLGIQDKYLCLSYLKELEPLLGTDYYQLRGSKTKRLKYEIAYIHPGNTALVSERGIGKEQDSFFKHKWSVYLKRIGLCFERDSWFTSELFGIVYTLLKQGGILLEKINALIKEVLWEAEGEDQAILGVKMRLTEAVRYGT